MNIQPLYFFGVDCLTERKKDSCAKVDGSTFERRRFARTSLNSQGISYLVIDDVQTLRTITAGIIDWVAEALKKLYGETTGYKLTKYSLIKGEMIL
ncbi:hypothetical protein [Megasphaera sueciensis]|jgi:hypothetical protein|uniref:hypothetical protein n=1 Tax=Megasphaera sueciensis TaxID=349094 RepID=UPI003D030FD4|nr:hypothetical protein [Megasphaera sp.]